jgi:hypothetical protein
MTDMKVNVQGAKLEWHSIEETPPLRWNTRGRSGCTFATKSRSPLPRLWLGGSMIAQRDLLAVVFATCI